MKISEATTTQKSSDEGHTSKPSSSSITPSSAAAAVSSTTIASTAALTSDATTASTVAVTSDATVTEDAEFSGLLTGITDQAKSLSAVVEKLDAEMKAEQRKDADGNGGNRGLSYLDIKNILLLSYNCDLINIMKIKTGGRSLLSEEASKSIDRLIETRTVLERLRSIDHKLRYQVDKLVRAANVTSQNGTVDPLEHRANLDNFDDDDEGDDNDGGGETTGKKDGIYKPPKLAAVRYEGDESKEEKREKKAKMRAKAIANASMLKDLDLDREEPEEIFENQVHRFKEDKRLEERTKYEEDNFTRLTLSKKEKARMNRMANSSAMGDVLTNFSDSKALWQDDDDNEGGGGGGARGKKRKREQGGAGGSGKGGKGGKKSKLSKGATKKIKSKKKKRFA